MRSGSLTLSGRGLVRQLQVADNRRRAGQRDEPVVILVIQELPGQVGELRAVGEPQPDPQRRVLVLGAVNAPRRHSPTCPVNTAENSRPPNCLAAVTDVDSIRRVRPRDLPIFSRKFSSSRSLNGCVKVDRLPVTRGRVKHPGTVALPVPVDQQIKVKTCLPGHAITLPITQ